ncbi:hypothetical protein [Streptomyces niveus]|uniref:hypothetical protein n=1 Tax=Streptomyces niveus TaxID=193462 RepID=UPI00378BD1A6
MLGQKIGNGGARGAAADAMLAGQGGNGLARQVGGAYVGDRLAREGRAASALVALGLGGPQPVVGQLPLEVALEFASGREGLHHELHGGEQFAGERMAGGEVHRRERL